MTQNETELVTDASKIEQGDEIVGVDKDDVSELEG